MNLDRLITDFQNRDIAAFEKLYEMYSPNIRGTIRSIVGNDEDAQEICQDVFVKVWHRANQYNASKGRFFTWLLNIARNAAIDRLRSKDFKNSKKNISMSICSNIYSIRSNDHLGNFDILGIDRLLERLNPDRRKILMMCYFNGSTQREVAQSLNVPLGTIKSRIRNSLLILRTGLTEKQFR
ncbi:RNA polymerase sigma factor [Pricia sp.]|uniref:RNA polymerase sigma factor n=1 Tax=Pricia sp. TaxID=2268138 RepID=UPI003593B97E